MADAVPADKKTPEELRVFYNNQIGRVRKWKQEHKEEVKKQNLDYWNAHKEKLNELRRKKYAEARAAVPADERRPIGRPKANITYEFVATKATNKEALKTMLRAEADAVDLQEEDMPDDILAGNVPQDMPEMTLKILGPQVMLPWNITERYYLKIGNWWIKNGFKGNGGIGDDFKRSCYNGTRYLWINCFNMPADLYAPKKGAKPKGQEAAATPEDDIGQYNPLKLVEWLYDNTIPDDVWKLIRFMEADAQKFTYDSRMNTHTKSVATILAAWLRWSLSKNLAQPNVSEEISLKHRVIEKWCQIIGRRARGAKQGVFDFHETQTPSERVMDNFMEYEEWQKLATNFVYSVLNKQGKPKNKNVGLGDMRDAAAIACYLFIPPVRNDWGTMEVNTELPSAKKDQRNVLKLTKDSAVAYWSKFKNSASFETLPLRQELPQALAYILWNYHQQNKGNKYLFPRRLGDEKSAGMTNGDFGEVLMNAGEKFTPNNEKTGKPKRIGASVLRIMYITYYHNTTDSIKDLSEVRKLMTLMHQTDVDVHLGYIKKVAKAKEKDMKKVALAIAKDIFINEEKYAEDQDVPIIVYDEEDRQEVMNKYFTRSKKKLDASQIMMVGPEEKKRAQEKAEAKARMVPATKKKAAPKRKKKDEDSDSDED